MLTQLIYASEPFGFDDAMLDGILLQARRNNSRDGLTGALIVRADLYLQLIEGPDSAISATYTRISRDNRHLGVTLLVRETVSQRMFPAWTMRDDPAKSWLWNADAIHAGALTRASPYDLRAVFVRAAADQAASATG